MEISSVEAEIVSPRKEGKGLVVHSCAEVRDILWAAVTVNILKRQDKDSINDTCALKTQHCALWSYLQDNVGGVHLRNSVIP